MLEINLTKNTNDAIQGTLGKYYGRVEYKGTLGVKDLAKIMKKHTTAFSLGEITGMLLDLAALIKEYALMGYVVKISDAGAGLTRFCRSRCTEDRRAVGREARRHAVCRRCGEDDHAGYR